MVKPPTRKINMIVIHHTAGRPDQSLEEIRQEHDKRGFGGIGYHVVIDSRGVAHQTRREDRVGAHCLGANQNSLGLSLIGYYENDGKYSFSGQKPSESQIKAIVGVCADWCRRYGIKPDNGIWGHFEAPRHKTATACPGTFLRAVLPTIRNQVEDKMKEVK